MMHATASQQAVHVLLLTSHDHQLISYLFYATVAQHCCLVMGNPDRIEDHGGIPHRSIESLLFFHKKKHVPEIGA